MAEKTQPKRDTFLDRAEWHVGECGDQVVGEFGEERQFTR
jgi:hypothetical protein